MIKKAEMIVKKGIGSFFRIFDMLRKIIINLVFWGIVAAAVVFYAKNNYLPDPEPGSVLLVRPAGILTEHSASSAPFLAGVSDQPYTAFRKLSLALNEAASDDNITSVLFDLRAFGGSGLSKLQEISASVKKVREAGKKVIVFCDYYTQGRYYLAAHADTVIIDPLGELMFTGLGDYRNYYAKGLEKFGIGVNIFRTGNYKTAVEPYMLEGMSSYARDSSERYLGKLWEQYLSAIASERKIEKKALESYIKNYPAILGQHGGSSAEAAVKNRLADMTGVYDDALRLAGSGGVIGWERYCKTVERREKKSGARIAVVIASGTIVPGRFPSGMIGASSYRDIFEKIRKDDNIKAVVLRIDSGGGGVGPSEEIRREAAKVRESGKPIVVSMSSVAASGAYWISSESDAILCMPSTLTGSIGVYAMFPDFSEFLEKYPGITSDGYGTTEYSHFFRPDISMTENMKKIMKLRVENDYSKFISFVAASRGMSAAEAEKLAGGRVWSGSEAVKNNLADREGSLEDAIALAAELAAAAAGESGGDESYSVTYFEPDSDWQHTLSQRLSRIAGSYSDAGFLRDSILSGMAGKVLGFIAGIFDSNDGQAAGPESMYGRGSQALYAGSFFLIE